MSYKMHVKLRAKVIQDRDGIVTLEFDDVVPIDPTVLREMLEQEYHLRPSQVMEVCENMSDMIDMNVIQDRRVR